MLLSTFLFTRIQYLPSLLDRMELQMTYQQMERYQAWLSPRCIWGEFSLRMYTVFFLALDG